MNYRATDIKFAGDASYILWDLKDLNAKAVSSLAPSIKIPEFTTPEDNFYTIPTILIPFYTYVLNRCQIPTPSQTEAMFWAMYGGSNSTSSHDLSNVPKELVRAKIYSEYAQIVRRFHLYLSLKESGLFDKVCFSVDRYIKHGIQYELTIGEKTYWLYTLDDGEELDMSILLTSLPPNVITANLTLEKPDNPLTSAVPLYPPNQAKSIYDTIVKCKLIIEMGND